jgi:hypothetical protein
VDAEKKWQRSEGDDTVALSRAADSIDADRANDDTPDEISLRRKTHLMRGYRELTQFTRQSARTPALVRSAVWWFKASNK